MENYNLHRRAQSGWHPTTYSRPVDKKPERNWAALMEAAKRKPRTDNDALEAKFGESAKGRPAGFELAREGSSPSSPAIPDGARGDDLYEPIGTMPVVGDEIAYPSTVTSTVMRATVLEVGVTALKNTGACPSWFLDGFRNGSYRILKRQPRKQVDGRVWKSDGPNADKSFLAVMMPDGSGSTYYSNCGWSRAEKRTLDIIIRSIELHGPGAVRAAREADAIIRECAKAMGLDHGTR